MDSIEKLTKKIEEEIFAIGGKLRNFAEQIKHLPVLFCYKQNKVIKASECADSDTCEFKSKCPVDK